MSETLKPYFNYFYDTQVVKLIATKYNNTLFESLSSFINSETYKMLIDEKLEMWEFSPLAIFDMWEVEQLTGDPRNSLYLRRDEYDNQ
ncbi:MAG: hypothetical protein NC090_07225 [Anaeroplasma bactoclasticum]|nr:hypothetical protein [Lachnospiraceae bacterium]MCM1514764.1 hypothetical protein [Anaeroplasma bactoclasticum]MCM1557657.1 hypothetical protein [Anaeroplasma bactoclasticum]